MKICVFESICGAVTRVAKLIMEEAENVLERFIHIKLIFVFINNRRINKIIDK